MAPISSWRMSLAGQPLHTLRAPASLLCQGPWCLSGHGATQKLVHLLCSLHRVWALSVQRPLLCQLKEWQWQLWGWECHGTIPEQRLVCACAVYCKCKQYICSCSNVNLLYWIPLLLHLGLLWHPWYSSSLCAHCRVALLLKHSWPWISACKALLVGYVCFCKWHIPRQRASVQQTLQTARENWKGWIYSQWCVPVSRLIRSCWKSGFLTICSWE